MKLVPRLVAFVVLAGAVIYFVGVRPRLEASSRTDAAQENAGRLSVNVVVAKHNPVASDLVLPASLRAFQEAPIYARSNGYLASYSVDIGDRVKGGQTLAVIDAAEVDQELNAARAALEQARANLELAKTSAARWQDLVAQKAVAQQEVDEKNAAKLAREADVHAAEANVSRLTQLKQYLTIVAPFDGVISARNVDVGALVTAGGGGRELFRIAQTDTLRVYANVPQTYVRSIHPGLPANVSINELPARTFAGKVVRIAGALDPASRTLQVEVQIPNDKGELFAGMFGQVRFSLASEDPPLLVPSNAVVLRSDGTFVVTVGADNAVHYQKVKLGRDFGTQVEIVDGLMEGTRVVSNPSDALTDGLVVEPIAPPAPAKKS